MYYDLPDDCGIYYRICHTCGGKYHMSGIVECTCAAAYNDGCKKCGSDLVVEDETTFRCTDKNCNWSISFGGDY